MLYNNRGLAFYHDDKLDEALNDFNKAINLDDSDPTIYFNRGNAYLNSKPEQLFDLAHQDYDKALSIEPKNLKTAAKLFHSKGLAYQGQAK